jgi:outer membrane protein assembly factor BamB
VIHAAILPILLTHLLGAPQTTAELSPGDWGQFRGPNGSGVGDSTALPSVIGPEDSIIWRTELWPGYSSPVLTEDCVFVTGFENDTLVTYCVERDTGEIRWDREAPEKLEGRYSPVNTPVSATPATDGENVYVFFPTIGLISYDSEGEDRWVLPLGPFNNPYGMGTSPVLAGDTLLLLCDADTDSFLIAVDTESGKELWRTARPGATHGFSSPVVYRPESGPAEVIVSGSYKVGGYSLETGEQLWWVSGMAWQAKCMPLLAGDMLYVSSSMPSPSELGVKKLSRTWEEAAADMDADGDSSISKDEAAELGMERLWFLYDMNQDGGMDEEEWGYALARSSAKNGLYAIELGGRGDVSESHIKWRYRRALPNIPSALHYDGLLYLLNETGVLTALDPATGEVIKDGRVEGAPGGYYASPVAADGKLFLANADGVFAVLEAGAEWKVLATGDFEEAIWSTPAIEGEQVILRTQSALYCFQKEL